MSNINPGHVNAFQAIRSQLYDNITLARCIINKEPGVAIVMMQMVDDDKLAVTPLFVSPTPAMEIDFPDATEWDGGGPKKPRRRRPPGGRCGKPRRGRRRACLLRGGRREAKNALASTLRRRDVSADLIVR